MIGLPGVHRIRLATMVIFAKLRHREPASEEARLPDQPIAKRVLEDPEYRFEDDD